MSSQPDAQPDGPDAGAGAGAEAEESVEPSGRWARARQSLRVPGVLVRLAKRDPHHIPERLTIYTVDRNADEARVWAERARDGAPDSSPAILADGQRRRTISTARIDGAVAGTPFFIALVPAYIAFLRQEVRFHLRVAALYGHDPADPRIAADFLVLRGVHNDPEQALAELEVVRATPLPPPGEHTPLKSWYAAIVRILIIAGFLSAPEEEETKQLTLWAKVMRAVRFVVAGLIWALTWILPVTFMIMMSWACESDARRFGQHVTTHYGDEGDGIAIAIAPADRKAGGNRALSVARGALVLLSVAIPLALIAATVAGGKGPLGVNVPDTIGALAALALVIGVSIAALRG
jgi:hypothetical protein